MMTGAADADVLLDTRPNAPDAGDRKAMGLKSAAADRLSGLAEEGRDNIVRSLDGLAQGAREFADKLGGQGGPVGDYAHRAAEMIGDWAHTIQQKDVRELVDDAKAFTQRSPVAALGAAVLTGFVLSRLLKSS
jgi:hypothetical protein